MATMESAVGEGKRGVKRYWVGWTSRHESIETPYPKWKTRASRAGRTEAQRDGAGRWCEAGATFRFSYAAVVDADDREKAWHEVARLYSDAEELFVREKSTDFWPPTDRFPQAS